MPNRTSRTGSELFIVDNSDVDWKVLRYLHDWCQISNAIDVATGYFQIGALLGLKEEWQKVDRIRILMGDEVSLRTKATFVEGLSQVRAQLDASLEAEKLTNDFLVGVPAIVEAIRSGKIVCRVYRKAKFHAKAYITHARLEVVGSSGLSWLVELHPPRPDREHRAECPNHRPAGHRPPGVVRRALERSRGRHAGNLARHRAPYPRVQSV
jgi:hypothetical protein